MAVPHAENERPGAIWGGFMGWRLYLPESWANDAQRRREAGDYLERAGHRVHLDKLGRRAI